MSRWEMNKLGFRKPGTEEYRTVGIGMRAQLYEKMGGKELSLYDFIQSLQTDIDSTGSILEDRDRELFENILIETISHKLRARIEESGRWVRDTTALMATLTTSMGLTFSLDWKEKKSEGEGELDTANLVTLLNKDRTFNRFSGGEKAMAMYVPLFASVWQCSAPRPPLTLTPWTKEA